MLQFRDLVKISFQRHMPTLKEWLRTLSHVELEPAESVLSSEREDILRSLVILKSKLRDSQIRLERLGISEEILKMTRGRSAQNHALKVRLLWSDTLY